MIPENNNEGLKPLLQTDGFVATQALRHMMYT